MRDVGLQKQKRNVAKNSTFIKSNNFQSLLMGIRKIISTSSSKISRHSVFTKVRLYEVFFLSQTSPFFSKMINTNGGVVFEELTNNTRDTLLQKDSVCFDFFSLATFLGRF